MPETNLLAAGAMTMLLGGAGAAVALAGGRLEIVLLAAAALVGLGVSLVARARRPFEASLFDAA